MLALQVVFNIAVFKNDRKEEDTEKTPAEEEATEDDVPKAEEMSNFVVCLLFCCFYSFLSGMLEPRPHVATRRAGGGPVIGRK